MVPSCGLEASGSLDLPVCDGFDIFRKTPNGETLWIESSPNLEVAIERIKLIAAKDSGEYIVFCQATQEVVATETAPKQREHYETDTGKIGHASKNR